MNVLTINNIKEFADELDCDNRALIHKTTGNLLFVPDTKFYANIYLYNWDSVLELLENNFTDYYEIEKCTSSKTFDVKTDFADKLTENSQLQRRLIEALDKKNSFREFKFVIDNSGEFRRLRFDFNNKRHKDFVERHLN